MTPNKLRPFTLRESVSMVRLGVIIRHTVDVELGELVLRIAANDDTAIPALHDRLNVLGQFEHADLIRAIIGEEGGAN